MTIERMTRTDLINHLIQKHRLKSYLEIGLQDSKQNFDKIECEFKRSVDPDPNAKAGFCMTSDNFFYQLKKNHPDVSYDIVFIDGLHTAEQVKKDFENALQVLSPNGFIVLHDCNPLKEEHTIVPRPTKTGHWNGDVFRFAMQLAITGVEFIVVDIDNGCGVWDNKNNIYNGNNRYFQWKDFSLRRPDCINLISWEQFINTN